MIKVDHERGMGREEYLVLMGDSFKKLCRLLLGGGMKLKAGLVKEQDAVLVCISRLYKEYKVK
jgi:hypothetical protein